MIKNRSIGQSNDIDLLCAFVILTLVFPHPLTSAFNHEQIVGLQCPADAIFSTDETQDTQSREFT
jgi:hypothetical protein